MAFSSSLTTLVLLLPFLLCISPSTSQRPKSLVIPVSKDPATLQYVLRLHQRTPPVPLRLSLHLGGRYLWVHCSDYPSYVSSTYRPVPCGTPLCKSAKPFGCDSCYIPPRPGCNNDACLVQDPENPFKPEIAIMGELAQDVVSVTSVVDGSNPGKAVVVPGFAFNCGFADVLENLAAGVDGFMGLGLSPVAAPAQFAKAFGFPRKFSICLPSSQRQSDGDGVVFFGDGPYNFPPGTDVSDNLLYTPIVSNPISAAWLKEPSSEYFIGVKSITVNNKPVPSLNATLLSIDKDGAGGVKISTAAPYTVLERSMYKAFTRAFVRESKLKKVPPVKPFGHCFDQTEVLSTRGGPMVPVIGLVMQGESVEWTFTGANTMVPVKPGVMCLGFVDGGKGARSAVVVGGYQLENNLVQFDLEKKRVGISGTLFYRYTSCSNFNLTTVA